MAFKRRIGARSYRIGAGLGANAVFKYGLLTRLPAQEIPDGAASDSKNWLTKRGKIELCRGYAPLGDTDNTAEGITGLIVGDASNTVQIPFRTHGKKAKYYNSASDTWIEIGSDMLGTAANGETISMAKFQSRAGRQVWFNSPNSGPKKIMVPNPGDYSDMYDSSKNYKANLFIKQNRAYNINISGKDNNVVRLSYEEIRELSDYTQIVTESVSASGTLAFKAGGAKRTCLDVTFTNGTETFADNTDGTLTGNLGGTGTINYTTGVFSLTFNSGPGAITATYRWVDETATWSGGGGIANFVVPGTRVSGDPNVFQQFTGGDIKSIFSLKEHRFCAHLNTVYDLSISLDDTEATNLIFRENFGIQSFRGGTEDEKGIYTVDVNDPANPQFVLIGWYQNATEITPKSISDQLDLVDYRFEDLVVFTFNEYVIFACRHKDADDNDTTFVYHKVFGTWDKLDYAISVLDIYNSTLISGHPTSNNVFTLFSGFDDEGVNIDNIWKSGVTKLGIKNLKKVKKIKLEGEIGPDQIIRLFVSPDRGSFVEILDSAGGPFISGSGSYVDHSQRVDVGAATIGSHEVGGGSDGVEAYHYERQLDFGQDKFSEVQYYFQATGIGYASVTAFEFHDLRIFEDKPPQKYRQ